MHTLLTDDFARALSRFLGWAYFFAWSWSFYPQPLLNFRRRTTQGSTPDYPLLNVLGFTCYTVSTAVFLFSPVVRSEYAARHPLSPEPTVRYNDLAFGVHAWIFCIVVYSQFYPGLWGWKPVFGVQKSANRITLGLLWGSLLAIAITIIIVFARGGGSDSVRGQSWGWIDVTYSLTYVKLLLTIFKYIPQVVANYRRKSTVGWSIAQQLLDFSGGVLSLLQLLIDSALQADWSGLTGNPVKFGLANISLAFDVVFIVQHYVLYGPVEEKNNLSHTVETAEGSREEDALLPSTAAVARDTRGI